MGMPPSSVLVRCAAEASPCATDSGISGASIASIAADFGRSAMAYPFTYLRVWVRPWGFWKGLPPENCGEERSERNWKRKGTGRKHVDGQKLRIALVRAKRGVATRAGFVAKEEVRAGACDGPPHLGQCVSPEEERRPSDLGTCSCPWAHAVRSSLHPFVGGPHARPFV